MAWDYSPKEFIKIYRKWMDWEWYTDVNTKTLFLHCLLRANWKECNWRGFHCGAGSFFTSLGKISEETGLSIQQVRTSLEKLESTGEITSSLEDEVTGKKFAKFRMITVNKWNDYQNSNKQATSNQQGSNKPVTSDQQASNKRVTTDIRSIEDKKVRREEEKESKSLLVPDDEGWGFE